MGQGGSGGSGSGQVDVAEVVDAASRASRTPKVWTSARRRWVGLPGLKMRVPSIASGRLGHVRVAEHDEVGGRVAPGHAGRPTGPGAGVVHEGDGDPVEVEVEDLGQHADERGVVVAEDGVHGRQRRNAVVGR